MGITKPPAYEHPRKRNRKGSVQQPETSAPRIQAERPIRKSEDSKTVHLRLAAHPPTKGQFDLYDEMIASGVKDKDAILALLRHGTGKLSQVASMSTSAFGNLSYSHDGRAIETNRKISMKLMEELKRKIDPYDVLTTRAFALKLGEAILVIALMEKSAG